MNNMFKKLQNIYLWLRIRLIMRLYLISISKVSLWAYNTNMSYTEWIRTSAVSNNRVLLSDEYASLQTWALSTRQHKLMFVHDDEGREPTAILRVWKLNPWLPEERWAHCWLTGTLTVKASVCSSGSISTSSGGCSTVSSSSGWGWNHC